MPTPVLQLGGLRALDGSGDAQPYALPASHLVTHAVIVGMTGSGKTGLVTVLVEEALRARIPVLMIDVKGDLADLALAFPTLAPEPFVPWLDPDDADRRDPLDLARDLASTRAGELASWGIDESTLADFHAHVSVRVITPGATSGEPLHLLSSLERRSPLWETDAARARESLGSAISLLLRLVGHDPDPARSREHALLSVLAEAHLREGRDADLGTLLREVVEPPVAQIGAMAVDDFIPPKDRHTLAAALNTLLASPAFAAWRTGDSLDVGAWLTSHDHKTPAVIVSVAHLDEVERAHVLGILLDETHAWVRSLSGTSRLRALVVFDEVSGFLPPHPANPPTKRPLVALMKQARAFGVGMVIATQNPMDLDYRALSNAGLWFVGRLQTDADRERVIDGLARSDGGAGTDAHALADTIKQLGARWFVTRDVHAGEGAALVNPRYAMSWLRGPLTQAELARLRAVTSGAREGSAKCDPSVG